MDRVHFSLRLVLLLVLFNYLVCIGGSLYHPVKAAPDLTIDMVYAASERADVRFGTTYLGVHIIYTDTFRPLPGAKVYFNEVPGQVYTNDRGWAITEVSSWDIGRYNLTVNRIELGSQEMSFQLNVSDASTIFDKVIIELSTPEKRVGINKLAPIKIDAYYASDNAPFVGEVIFNYPNFTSSELGLRTYIVQEINDTQYGLTQFEANTVDITYDYVNVTFWINENRIETGSEAEFEWTAYHVLDGAVFQGWVEFNNSLIQDEPGVYTYSVESIFDTKYDVSSFIANSVEVIFDEVIVKLEVGKERIDVGDKADISWNAYYWYNSEPFYGVITLNRESVTSHMVGIKDYYVQSVEDYKHGLSSFDTNIVEVKWDVIEVELQAADYRLNLGEEAKITWRAVYQSDGFDVTDYVDLDLIPAILTKDSVGELLFEVANVKDNLNGIQSHTSNYVNVVWDRIEVELIHPGGRTEVGTYAPVDIIATYGYDGAPFTGNVQLDGSLVSDMVGSRSITVSSVEDDKYGITSYSANKVTILWDEIIVDKTVNSMLPGKVTVSLDVSYASDGRPVKGAEVYIGGKRSREVEPGIYVRDVSGLMPFSSIAVDVRSAGINQVFNFGNQLNVGNIGLYAVFLATAVVAAVYKGPLKILLNKK